MQLYLEQLSNYGWLVKSVKDKSSCLTLYIFELVYGDHTVLPYSRIEQIMVILQKCFIIAEEHEDSSSDDGTTNSELPDNGTTNSELPDDGTNNSDLPDDGTTNSQLPDDGTDGIALITKLI